MKKSFNIQAKLDLHGYTLQAGFDRFVEFVEFCVENELQNLLVVTGKGAANKTDQTINYEFKHWCENRLIAPYIKSVNHAEISHGGSGAFYIKLK